MAPERRRLLAALHALRQIDRVIINAAIDLGADNGWILTDQIYWPPSDGCRLTPLTDKEIQHRVGE